MKISQAAAHYQVSAHLIRLLIAHEQLDARRIGSGRAIRIDRVPCLGWGVSASGGHRDAGYITVTETAECLQVSSSTVG